MNDELEYLRRVEGAVRDVVDAAAEEGWLTFDPEGDLHQTPLQRAVNKAARHLRFVHYKGDGCLHHVEDD